MVDRCIACNYYDRGAKETDSRGVQWGQCRRQSPMLHPVNQKTYMIEGVWPHVRDDDWCGEWKPGTARRSESRGGDPLALGPLIPVPTGASLGVARPAPRPVAATSSFATQSGGAFASSSGRGD
ncbi:MAG: hypothetical protein U1F10_09725 [Burkholderiales bacterium]